VLLEHFRSLPEQGSENVESRNYAALLRVASKGVYAGGGSIAEAIRKRKIAAILLIAPGEALMIGVAGGMVDSP
jgi:hypothetical protein